MDARVAVGGVLLCAVFWGIVIADEIVEPPSHEDISQVPPFAENLVHNEREIIETQRKKDFKDIMQQVVAADEKGLDVIAKNLANDTSKFDHFLSGIPSKLVKEALKEDASLTNEQKSLLGKQFDDPLLGEKKITINLRQADIHDAIELVAKHIGVNFIVDQKVYGKIQKINLQDIPAAVALRLLLQNNEPPLALVKDHEIFRIVRFAQAKQFLIEQQEKDFSTQVITLEHAVWTEQLRLQIEKMWQGILGGYAGKDGFYLVCDEYNKKIFFRGHKHHINAITSYLKEIDCLIPQIKIEARFVCAEKGFEENFGFQWSGIYNRRASLKRGVNFIGGGKPLSDISNTPGPQSQDSLVDWALNFLPTPALIAKNVSIPFVFGGNDLNTKRLNLVLNAAENRNEIKTILNPSVLTNDKELAEILVGENVPIETIVEESVEGRLRNVTTANYKDIGIQLKVKPIVAIDKQTIFLDIYIENSQQNGTVTTKNTNYPVIRTTRSKSRVAVRNGQTTMISGLIKDIKENYKTSAPIVGEIPVLGWLFSGSRKVTQDMQLLIFITPTIL